MENEKIILEEVSTKECNCLKCGKNLESDAKFCSGCGAIVELQKDESICKKCDTEIDINILSIHETYCEKCKILNTNNTKILKPQFIIHNSSF